MHPPSLCSACKSACGGSSHEILSCLPGYRVAIWERNLVVSAIAVAAWLMSSAVYILGTFFLTDFFAPEVLILRRSASRYSEGAVLLKIRCVLLLRLIAQTESLWSSESNSCLVLHSERNVANLTVMLVEDSVLLVLMLSGLRRYRLPGMAGIWRLLHRQVSGSTLYT